MHFKLNKIYLYNYNDKVITIRMGQYYPDINTLCRQCCFVDFGDCTDRLSVPKPSPFLKCQTALIEAKVVPKETKL